MVIAQTYQPDAQARDSSDRFAGIPRLRVGLVSKGAAEYNRSLLASNNSSVEDFNAHGNS